jgi:response regulator RpfG family c-di-GMP phosphodiesterase
MSQKISFLIVDDESSIVMTLNTIISKSFPNCEIHTAYDGVTGWNKLNEHHPSIVLSDLNMPGMDGLELCKKVREKQEYNDIYFVILTAIADKEKRLQALESGADDFIPKPFSADELRAKLRSAFRITNLQNTIKRENKLLTELTKQLENDFNDMKNLSVKFMQARIPASTEMMHNISKASMWIAKEIGNMDEHELMDIDIAASLSYAGKVLLPDELIKTPVMMNGRPSHHLMFQVPTSAKEIISSVGRFENAGKLLYHLYENFDGSGIPDRLQSWQIPLGSRIIRVALEFYEIRYLSSKSSREVIEIISRESKRLYDNQIVVLMEQYISTDGSEDKNVKEKAINLQELEVGMILARDIVTTSGFKLMTAGTVVRAEAIKKVIAHSSSDSILGNIVIKNP